MGLIKISLLFCYCNVNLEFLQVQRKKYYCWIICSGLIFVFNYKFDRKLKINRGKSRLSLNHSKNFCKIYCPWIIRNRLVLINNLFSFVFVITSLIVNIKIFTKYRKKHSVIELLRKWIWLKFLYFRSCSCKLRIFANRGKSTVDESLETNWFWLKFCNYKFDYKFRIFAKYRAVLESFETDCFWLKLFSLITFL